MNVICYRLGPIANSGSMLDHRLQRGGCQTVGHGFDAGLVTASVRPALDVDKKIWLGRKRLSIGKEAALQVCLPRIFPCVSRPKQ
jgi:hypothetical protein